ncbi:MAG: hypothetical protein ACXVJJ_08010, partial [Halobacteriota archaeon]
SFVYFYGGYPFLKGIVSELRARLPGMMTLIAVAITTAYLYSTAITCQTATIIPRESVNCLNP